MDIENIASIVGAITGSISLLGLVYVFGIWRGKVDSRLCSLGQCVQDYPPAEMWTMAKTLWDIYVVDALQHRPDLAEHGSAFRLKEEGKNLIPEDIKPLLDNISLNTNNSEEVATGYLVAKHIGMELIGKMAQEKQLTVQESIAILSCYLDRRPTA